jgi:hypothetical protein
MVGAPVGTPAERGNCSLESVSIHLAQSGGNEDRQEFSGSHSGGSLICQDLSAEEFELSGMTDSILPLPAGPIRGDVGWLCLSERRLLPWEPCDGELVPFVTLELGEQEINGGVQATSLTGSFGWVADGAVRVHGSWIAIRDE